MQFSILKMQYKYLNFIKYVVIAINKSMENYQNLKYHRFDRGIYSVFCDECKVLVI